MRFGRLSLVAVIAATLSQGLFAADTLADAFKNGKVNGNLKAYYFNRNNNNTPANITSLGLNLNFITDKYKGFTVGITAQAVDTPNINTAGKTAFNDDMYGSGAILSEAYLKYQNSGAYIKAGRQYIDSPLVANDDSRIAKDAFEAYVIGYEGIKDTTLMAAYITKFQDRTDKSGGIDSFNSIGNGAWTIFASTTLNNLTLSGAYLKVNQDNGNQEAAYLEGLYSTKLNTVDFTFNAQYFYGKDNSDTTGGNDGKTYALEISGSLDKLSGYVAYSKNSSDKATFAGIGTGSGPLYTAAPIAEANFDAGYRVVAINVEYTLSEALNAYLFYSNNNHNAQDTASLSTYDIYGAGADYSFGGMFRGLDAIVQYEVKDFSFAGLPNDKEFRLKAKYSF